MQSERWVGGGAERLLLNQRGRSACTSEQELKEAGGGRASLKPRYGQWSCGLPERLR